MKRTFLVEIDGELEEGFGVEGVCDVFDQFIVAAQVSVTETTAVHAKEREVIEAAMATDWAAPMLRIVTAGLYQRIRELRALMEGEA